MSCLSSEIVFRYHKKVALIALIPALQIFSSENYHEYPFPHWIVDNFFEVEELDVLNKHFPSSQYIANSLRKSVVDLNHAIEGNQIPEACLAKYRLGYREAPLKSIDHKSLLNAVTKGKLYEYLPGESYSMQLSLGSDESLCDSSIGSYTDCVDFNSIISNLEFQWQSSVPIIIKELKSKLNLSLTDKALNLLFCRGDLRAASPFLKTGRTTLGPHIDSERQLFAGLIYLRHPDDHSDGGDLILYERKSNCPKRFMSASRRIPMRYLSVAKKIKYESNKAIFFPNLPLKSIHSVSTRGKSLFDRRNINISIEIKKAKFWNGDKFVDNKLNIPKYSFYQSVLESSL